MIYLNNAATSFPKSPAARLALLECLDAYPADIRTGRGSSSTLEGLRTRAATALGVARETLFFLSDATLALNAVIKGWQLGDDDRMVFYDNRSHNAVARPASTGHLVAFFDSHDRIQRSSLLDLPQSSCLVCLSVASNVSGAIYEIGTLCAELRARYPRCRILLDASQFVGSSQFALPQDADFIVFPGHKFLYAPAGAAILIARAPLPAWIEGGTGDLAPSESAFFTEVGTPNLPAIASLVAAIEETAALGTAAFSHSLVLRERLRDELAGVPGLEPVAVGTQATTSVISFRCRGLQASELGLLLAQQGISARAGFHCNLTHHAALGICGAGTLRFSPGRYNTLQNILDAAEALREIQARIKAWS